MRLVVFYELNLLEQILIQIDINISYINQNIHKGLIHKNWIDFNMFVHQSQIRVTNGILSEKKSLTTSSSATWRGTGGGSGTTCSSVSDDGRHTRNSACPCRSRGRHGAPRGASPWPLGETTAPHHAKAVVTRNEHGDPMLCGIELVRTHKELKLGRESWLH